MKKSLVLILAAAIGLSACNNFKKAPSGTLYKIHKSGGKEKIKVGDYVKFNFIQKSDKDSIMKSTYDGGEPAIFQVPAKTYAGDLNDVLTYFGEGDSATFKVDLDTMAKYSNQPRPAELKGKYMVFNVKIEKVLSKGPNEADSVYNRRAGEFFQKDHQDALLKKKNAEPGIIKAYETEKNLKTTVSPSGLHYAIVNAGTGEKPALGDTVILNYTGKMARKKIDGKENIFETTDAKLAKEFMPPNPTAVYEPRPLVIGQAILGMNEGLQMLGKGGKATFIIPSSLAWGENGASPVIGAYATVVFEVDIKEIKKATTPAVVPPAPVKP